jgi:F420-non-reducing hydrogenase small subunit
MMAKLKVGMYWAGSCGGCEISFLEIAEHILDLLQVADLVFCPCIMDTKYDDIRAMADGEIDVCMVNGCMRNTENVEIARLLRQKSKVIVAFGSCANEGCIPALGNLYPTKSLLDRAYLEAPSNDNPTGVMPSGGHHKVPEGEIHLPTMLTTVQCVDDVIDVDYHMPGCPPTEKQIWAVLQVIASGALPPKGSWVGCGNKSVCDECPRTKRNTRIQAFQRPHLAKPEPDWCLLEQGIVCMGPATRDGCEARCVNANMPCRGCYGTHEHTADQGAAMISAIGSLLGADDEDTARAIDEGFVDPVGTVYRFSLAKSMLGHRFADVPRK